jgi:hypothetical protein
MMSDDEIRESLISAGFPDGKLPPPAPEPVSPVVFGLELAQIEMKAKKLASDAQRLRKPVNTIAQDGVRESITAIRAALDFIESAMGSSAQGWDEALGELD